MENLLLEIPTTPLGFFAMLLGIIAGVVWLASRVRREDLKLLRESNDDLRKAHEDNEKQILVLKEEVGYLKMEVQKLKSEKKNLETLVIEALELYFQRNPKEALKLKTG